MSDNINQQIIKTHDDDVIFSYESLKEFIRLIQRQGINNLTVYSVNDLLDSNLYTQIMTKDGLHNEFIYTKPNGDSDDGEELKKKKGHLVFVRYSYGWKNGWKNETTSFNEASGRHLFVKTLSDITFNENSVFSYAVDEDGQFDPNSIFEDNKDKDINGTFVINVDNIQYIIKIKGFDDSGNYTGVVRSTTGSQATFLRGDGKWTNEFGGNFLPTENNKFSLGSTTASWKYLYAGAILPNNSTTSTLGNNSNHWHAAYIDNLKISNNTTFNSTAIALGSSANRVTITINGQTWDPTALPGGASTAANFLRGDKRWTNHLQGSLTLDPNYNTSFKLGAYGSPYGTTGTVSIWFNGTNATNTQYATTNTVVIGGSGNVNLKAKRVYGAVFNDYAECRSTIDLEPGRVVIDNDDGTLSCASQRLSPGAQVISDTYGNLMGETETAKTPIAVAGRVLVYPYQPRENYHAGMAVCSAPEGTVDIMTREEIKEYPDCIVGIVSEIPQYDTWGTDNVIVNNRIWIKV